MGLTCCSRRLWRLGMPCGVLGSESASSAATSSAAALVTSDICCATLVQANWVVTPVVSKDASPPKPVVSLKVLALVHRGHQL